MLLGTSAVLRNLGFPVMLNAAVRTCALSPMVGFSISQGFMSDSPNSNPKSKEDFFHLNESAYTVLPHSDGLLSWTTVWLFTLVVSRM